MKRLAILLLAAAPALALAHHGWSEYDAAPDADAHRHGREVRLRASARLRDAADAAARRWTAVLAPPSRMENRGLTRAMLKPGTKVTVVGYPNRSKPDEMRAERITVGGKTVELR